MLIVAFAKPAENQGMDRFEAAVLRCGLVSGVHLWSPAQARVVSTVRFFLRARAVILRDAVLLGPGRVPIVAIAVARGVRGGRECDDSDRKSRRKSHRDVGWHVHFSSYCGSVVWLCAMCINTDPRHWDERGRPKDSAKISLLTRILAPFRTSYVNAK